MQKNSSAGPAVGASWQERRMTDRHGRALALMLLPDAASYAAAGPAVFYYVPKVPALARDAGGAPRLSLSVVLCRQPRANDEAIGPLIQSGLLSLGLSLAVAPEILAQVAAAAPADYRPLFARTVLFSIEDSAAGGRGLLASAGASGPDASAALSRTLDRAQAVAVLGALDGATSGLTVRARISYRTAPHEHSVRLTGSWASVFDAVRDRLGPDGTIGLDELRIALSEMIRSGVLSVDPPPPDPLPGEETAVDPALAAGFLRVASFVLRRETPRLDPGSPDNRYSLRARPNPLMPLDIAQTLSGPEEQTLELAAPLEQVLAGAIEVGERERCVSLVAPAPGEQVGVAPIPRLFGARRAAPGSAVARGVGTPLRLAAWRGHFASMALAMTADHTLAPTAHQLIASDVVHPIGPRIDRIQHWLADDMVLERPGGSDADRQPLPIVSDATAACWQDRVEPATYWYAPSFVVVQPEPNQDPAVSPFLFRYVQSGVTLGGTLVPGLDGTVRFTVRSVMSDASTAALGQLGNPTARPVPLDNLSVSLELPFRDNATGATKVQSFAARVEADGEAFRVTVDLLNDWVRLCYGALAYAGFQAQPARLRMGYAFRAYVPLPPGESPVLAFGAKIALTRIAAGTREAADGADEPVFDAQRTRVLLPGGELRFEREALRDGTGRARAAPDGGSPATRGPSLVAFGGPLAGVRGAGLMMALHPATLAAIAVPAPQPSPLVILARPQLSLSPAALSLLTATRYAIRTVTHEESVDVLYPCATCGGLYVQGPPENQLVIGCQDALRLGQIASRQFEEITALRDAQYRAYRSLQQPGRFLVVPAAYRITRYGPAEPPDRAYRPVILIYAILGAAAASSRYFFTATLEPDLPYHKRRDLERALAAYCPSGRTPAVVYPTDPDVQASTAYRWALPAGIAEPEVQQTWDSFRVSLSTNLVDALALTTLIEGAGISGTATFTLPDGLVISSDLLLDTQIVGPWSLGPVAVSLAPGQATLANRIEVPVSVFDVVTSAGAGPPQRVKADVSLAPGESRQVALPAAADEAYPVYSIAAQHVPLRQLAVFAEDVVSNVIFVNLVNYANHGLVRLGLQARLKDTEHAYAVEIAEGQSAALDITLPLTTYLENQTLQFQVTKTTAEAATTTTAWLDWDLKKQGNVVSLTWDLIQ